MSRENTGICCFGVAKFFAFLFLFVTFSAGLTASSPEHPEHHGAGHGEEAMPDTAHHSDASHEEEEFSAATMSSFLLHHIQDAHEWHFFTIGETHVTLPLPVILYSKQHGLDIFLSSAFDHHTHLYKNYKMDHGHIILVDDHGQPVQEEQKEVVDGQEVVTRTNVSPLDFSITKNVASMLIAVAIILAIFLSVAKAYKKRPGQAPKGLQSFMEPLILFVRDDIAKPNLGHHYQRFTPYLLTLFFFIWVNNLLGLLPGAANVTGNIAITMFLALLTLIITNVNGNKSYWAHIFWPPGIPFLVKLILIPVEIISIFTKPFALMIRLFANITAGHILIMSILCLIFLFSENGANPGLGIGVSFISVPFALFLYAVELLVGAIQAFIFTMLTALFIGQAMPEEHH